MTIHQLEQIATALESVGWPLTRLDVVIYPGPDGELYASIVSHGGAEFQGRQVYHGPITPEAAQVLGEAVEANQVPGVNSDAYQPLPNEAPEDQRDEE